MEILKEDKLCVCCGKQFRGDISFCPDDDDQLVSLNENPFEGTQFEREFQILSVLGWGGWGIVYRARDILIERNVAIKMLHSHLAASQQRQRRFKREATVLADLNHPNIATVLKYDTLPDSRPFVVMEFLEGKTLEETLAETGLLAIVDAVSVFIDTCDALDFAHAKGVVHRDIKPSNLMLVKDHHGQTAVKVLDFGLAKIFSLYGDTNLTRTGETIGTPNYMSPEQCRGMALDQRSDVYSLGCVMYEAITGVKPVSGDCYYDCMQRHVSGDVIPPSVAARGGNVGVELEQIIMHAMARDPENRYQDAAGLKSDLESLASTMSNSKGVSARKTGRYDRKDWKRLNQGSMSKNRLVVLGGFAACFAVVGLLVGLLVPVNVDIKNKEGKTIYSMTGRLGDGQKAAVLEANRKGIDLENAYLDGADLSGLSIDNSMLIGASLVGAKLKGTRFVRGPSDKNVLEMANLSGADLTGAVLKTQLLEDNFSRATLVKADLDGGLDYDNFSEANLAHANIRNNSSGRQPTTFEKANLSNATLRGWFSETDFRRANLQNADLSNTIFNGCDFSDADLTGADFRGSDVKWCTFTGAKLTGTKFEGAKGLKDTVGLR